MNTNTYKFHDLSQFGSKILSIDLYRLTINTFFLLFQVYMALFKPLRVSRHQFKLVLNCMKLVRSLKYQEVYAQEKVTKVDSLSLVLSGK